MAEKKVALDLGALGTPPMVQGDSHQTIYINSSRVGISAWDIRFSLGQVVERTPNVSVNQDMVTVIMAPGHAKAFLAQVTQSIQAYEDAFGPIHDPTPSILAARQAKKAIEGSMARAMKRPAAKVTKKVPTKSIVARRKRPA